MSRYRITTISELYLLRNNSGTVARVPLDFGNKADFKPDVEDIEFEGGGQKTTKYFMTGFKVEIEADTWSADDMATIFGNPAVTTGLPTGVAKRWVWGTNKDSNGTVCGLEAVALAEDIDTNTTKRVAIVAPIGTLSTVNPPSLANVKKAPMKLEFSAKKTTKDIAGDDLEGYPDEGGFWHMDELS